MLSSYGVRIINYIYPLLSTPQCTANPKLMAPSVSVSFTTPNVLISRTAEGGKWRLHKPCSGPEAALAAG